MRLEEECGKMELWVGRRYHGVPSSWEEGSGVVESEEGAMRGA